jgi:hypothetical protein
MARRAELNLEPTFVDYNTDKLADPTLNWIDNPQVNCTSVLIDKRYKDNL